MGLFHKPYPVAKLYHVPLVLACSASLNPASADLVYVPLSTPCRIVNTTAGGSVVDFAHQRVEPLKAWGDTATALQNQGGGDCVNPKAPEKPKAMTANVTAVTLDRRLRGSFVAFAHGGTPPAKGSLVNFFNNNIANSSMIPLADNDAFQFDVLAKKVELIPGEAGSPQAGLIVDVLGYFYESGPSANLKNIVTVALDDTTADFNDPIAAIESITDASSSNPYLLDIGPGHYVLSEPLQLQEYITVRGAGVKETVLEGTSGEQLENGALSGSVVLGANHATLMNLTLENTGGSGVGPFRRGLFNKIDPSDPAGSGGVAPTVDNVNINIANGDHCFGIVNERLGGNARIMDTHITVDCAPSAYGVFNFSGAAPSIQRTHIKAMGAGDISDAVHSTSGSDPVVRYSTLEGDRYGVRSLFASTASVSFSKIIGGSNADNDNDAGTTETHTCLHVVDDNNAPLDSDCLTPP